MQKSDQTSEKDYADLLALYWREAPGKVSDRQQRNVDVIQKLLGQPDKLDQAAVTLNFIANENLLLAGNLLAHGQLEQAWSEFDKAQSRAFLAHKLYWKAAWLPSVYSAPIFSYEPMCAYFCLAMARSSDTQATWYAQQIYNLRRGGLAEECCLASEYVELHWELAIAWLNQSWPQQSDVSDQLGEYADLFLGDSEGQLQALVRCADYHMNIALSVAPKADIYDNHPFKSRYVGHVAYELMGWSALSRRLNSNCRVPAD